MNTTLVKLVTPIEQIGSMDIEPDEYEILAVRQHLMLKAQKAWTCYERYTRLHWEVEEDALEQPNDQQQYLPPPKVPPVMSNLLCKEENKLHLE